MNIFRFGRGDFFGIIIPGAFLLINLILFFGKPETSIEIPFIKTILIPWFIVVSYLFGFFLRSISPYYIEYISFHTVLRPWNYVKAKLFRLFSKKYKAKKLKESRFPYIEWFFKNYLPKTPKFYSDFYLKLLEEQFENDKNKMKGLFFINQCKISVFEKSTTLREDIIFSEGLVRFLSGTIIALIICIFICPFFLSKYYILLLIYLVLYIAFCKRIKDIRMKEAVTILDSYAFVELNNRKLDET